MLAPQLGNGVHVLLAQPDHVGTQVLLLAIFLLVDRAPRRWYTVAALWVLLTATVVADKIAIVDAAVPLAFVAVLHAIWASTARKGRRAEQPGLRAGRSLVGACPARCGGSGSSCRSPSRPAARSAQAELIITGISRLGGFALMPMETGLVTPGRRSRTPVDDAADTLNLFGADVGAAQPGPQTVFAWLHAPGVALAAAAIGLRSGGCPAGRDLISDVLAVGLVVNLAGFVASVIPATPFDAREMAAALPYGAVLAGRVFGPWLASPRPNSSRVARSLAIPVQRRGWRRWCWRAAASWPRSATKRPSRPPSVPSRPWPAGWRPAT